jgi:hypothetical protein
MKALLKIMVLTFFISSCTTAKIQHYEPKEETSNGLLEIKNPHYKKKVNALGYVTMVGSAAGLGYLGYTNPFVKYNSETEQVESPEASAAIAGLAGLGLVITGNYTFGQKDKLLYLENNPNDLKKWAGKYSDDYKVVLTKSNRSKLLLINNNAEQYYTFRNMEDVDIFVESFPNSNHNALICSRSYKNLNYTDLPDLLKKVNITGSPTEKEIKLYYINSSRTLSEYISALKLYPNIKEDPYADGIDYIGSMVDVAKYTEYFSTPDKSRLIEKAVNFATTFNTVKYFNTEFPSNPYYDKVILDVIPTSSDNELEELVNLFPKSASIDKVKEVYILRANNAYSFIERNAKYDFYNFNSSYALSNAKECKNFILAIKNNSNIPERPKNEFIASASEVLLSKKYEGTNTTDRSQKDFISFVRNNSWLSQVKADTYIKRANNQIQINANRRYLVENELDDVYKYVSVTGHSYEDADGEELGFWDGILSTMAERINKKLFLKVNVTNYGSKEKKVKVIAYLNMINESESIWGKSKKKSQLKKEYILNIPPNTTSREMLVEYNYQIKYKDERSIWGRNYYYYGPDMDLKREEKLFDFRIEYYDSYIPSSQEILKREAEKSYQNRTRGRSSGSRYMVDSKTHTVLEDKRCYVDVKRLTDNTDSNGCISIYADDVSSSYSSTITTNNSRSYNYSSEDKDDFTECFDYSDFPLIVSVRFINDSGKQVSSKVRLERFYDYDITVK